VAASSTEVEQEAAPPLTVAGPQRVEPPVIAKVTVPVAVKGRPLTDSVTVLPYEVLDGLADAVKEVDALVMVKLVVAVEPL
jgi:hypothetical protein